MTERVNYDAQINQIPAPYYYPQATGSSRKKQAGMTVAGGLIGMNAYYLPVKKDVFVQRGFDMKRNSNFEQIRTLKTIAEEVEKHKLSTQSKMVLLDMGLPENISAITNKCTALEKEVSEASSVKNIKNHFINTFDTHKNNTHLMDSQCSDAFRAVKRNKFWWGIGIGSSIGLATGLITGRD